MTHHASNPASPPVSRHGPTSLRQRGQIIVIFAGSMFALVALCAVVVDVAWYWTGNLRMQRAADAAALAGVVWLPGDPTSAYNTARAEAVKNGYTNGTGGVVVTPLQDPTNARRLKVTISGPVGTFFARVVGLNSFPAKRDAKADYVLPVPMGSPENYYGVFGTLRNATFTQPQTVNTPGNTGLDPATAVPSTTWTTPINADGTQNLAYAVSPTAATNTNQQWSTFNFITGASPQIPAAALIDGLQLEFRGMLTGSGTSTACKVNVDLSWQGGAAGTWSTVQATPNLTTTKTTYPLIGSATDTTAWGAHGWVRNDFSTANFRVRLSWGSASGATQVNLPANCATTRTVSVDTLRLNVYYHTTTTTNVMTTTNNLLSGPGTACANGRPNCYNPDGSALNPRGFWATMNTRGASNVNGDAHQPYYDTAGSTVAPTCPAGDSRSCYDPAQYYNYAVEMPPNSTGGYVYVFDPVFCATATSSGTGDRWFGTANGVSSWFELRGPDNTPYDFTDDPLIATTGSQFVNIAASDTTMGGSSGSECKRQSTAYGDGRDYHDAWLLLNPGNPLTGDSDGTVYRLHTTGTDPNNVVLSTTDGEQSFALFATATGGTPKIYGLGAMQMFTPLSSSGGSTSSEFYLAQIEGVHAGKTVVIQLWDPGDTSPLQANLQILVPSGPGTWSPAVMTYRAKVGTTNSTVNSACNSNTGTGVSSITTSTGASLGQFNGCWLTIEIAVPSNYTGENDGWWKIRYNMTGSGTSNDVTTWKVNLRGNPVHLVLP